MILFLIDFKLIGLLVGFELIDFKLVDFELGGFE